MSSLRQYCIIITFLFFLAGSTSIARENGNWCENSALALPHSESSSVLSSKVISRVAAGSGKKDDMASRPRHSMPTLTVPLYNSEIGLPRTLSTHLNGSYTILSLLSSRMRLDAFSSADTSKNYHRLEVFSNSANELATVRLTVGETQPVEITAFNILGKRVMDIYTGEARVGVNLVSFDVSQLSHGMYICVVRGQRFKIAEKFLVSR